MNKILIVLSMFVFLGMPNLFAEGEKPIYDIGRYQLFEGTTQVLFTSKEGQRSAFDVNLIMKIDTKTGKTWIYNARNFADNPEENVSDWMPIRN